MNPSSAALAVRKSVTHYTPAPSFEALLGESITDIAKDIVANTTPRRTDRLWPPDVMVFQTNGMSLAYGAGGTALFLQDALGGVPAAAEQWMLSQPLSASTHPPGFSVGLAGIAQTFAWLGHTERADETMKLTYKSSLLFEEASVMHGVAGWGLVSLSMYAETGNALHLDHAVVAGEHLLSIAQPDGDDRFWMGSDGLVHFGYAHGVSGVGCFLLRLYNATGEEKFRQAAIDAMDFTLRHAYGEDTLQWFAFRDGRIIYPYWRTGTAGIGIALLRYYQALGDDKYLDAARRAAGGVRMLFSALPGQFDGMSGVGEFYLDLHSVTGEPAYHREAVELAKGVMCFEVKTDDGKCYPGRGLLRLSTDYAYGSAGVGAFFQRILAPDTRNLEGRLYWAG